MVDTGLASFVFCLFVIFFWFQFCSSREKERELNHIKTSMMEVFGKLTLAVGEPEQSLRTTVVQVREEVFDLLFVTNQHKEEKYMSESDCYTKGA